MKKSAVPTIPAPVVVSIAAGLGLLFTASAIRPDYVMMTILSLTGTGLFGSGLLLLALCQLARHERWLLANTNPLRLAIQSERLGVGSAFIAIGVFIWFVTGAPVFWLLPYVVSIAVTAAACGVVLWYSQLYRPIRHH